MRAKKSLGQNFLRDVNVVRRIIDALGLQDGDAVVEIGPGRGALTGELIRSGVAVLAIEFDRDLIEPLRTQFRGSDNFRLIQADALGVDLAGLVAGTRRSKLVANLPYNVSTPILQRLIDQRDIFERLVLMFQREVVERITAKPPAKERGFLTVLVEDAFEVDHLFDVQPGAFRPVPKVWSSVVRLTPKEMTSEDPGEFRRLLSAAFAHKRKTILNNLKTAYPQAPEALVFAGIEPARRAESLTLEEWRKLAGALGRSAKGPDQN